MAEEGNPSLFDKSNVLSLRDHLEQFLSPCIFHRFVLIMNEIGHATHLPDYNTDDSLRLTAETYAEACRRFARGNTPDSEKLYATYLSRAFRYALAAHLSTSIDAIRLPPSVDLAISLSWDVSAAVDPVEFDRYEDIWDEVKLAFSERRFGPRESMEALRKLSEVLKPYEYLSRRLLELPWPHLQESEVETPPRNQNKMALANAVSQNSSK